jgi:hypothetical protein
MSRTGAAVVSTFSQPWRRGGLFLLVLCVLGCSGGGGAPKAGETEIRGLAVCYGQFLRENRGKSPANEAAFKTFIQTKVNKEQLASFGITPDNLEKLFTSSRDGQPYQVRYNAPQKPPGADGKGEIVIWERAGSGGKRMVAYATVQIEEIDEARFKEIMPGQ